jgi:hypothetical protein
MTRRPDDRLDNLGLSISGFGLDFRCRSEKFAPYRLRPVRGFFVVSSGPPSFHASKAIEVIVERWQMDEPNSSDVPALLDDAGFNLTFRDQIVNRRSADGTAAAGDGNSPPLGF